MDKPKSTERKGFRVISNHDLVKMYDAIHESIDWMKEHDLIDVKMVLLGLIKRLSNDIITITKNTKTTKLSSYNKKRFHKIIMEKAGRIIKAAKFIERVDCRLKRFD
jgi:hypothetical protein